MNCIKATLFHLRKVHTIKTVKHILHVRHRGIPFLSRSAHSEPIEDDTDIIVKSICQGDQELEKKLRVLMLEVEVMRQDGRQAPEYLRQDQWERLLKLSSKNQRSSFLSFLFKTEKAKENQKAKKEARKIKREAELDEQDVKEFPDDLDYGIKYQTLFLRIRDQSINNFDNYRALKSILYGQPMVVDCSYEQNMVWRETKNAAKQMTMVLGNNRLHKEPFDIHMCNVSMNGEFMAELRKNVPILEDPGFPINLHTKSYLDIFPREKLVYLTPHCREELTTFDHDAVYIIGCMVDTMNNEPLSLARAKRDGLRMAKLPIERYIEWAPGAKKNLNINHMVPILLDLKLSGDWHYAFRHIPKRKLMETKILAMQKAIKNNNFLKDEIFKSYRSVKGSKLLSKKMKTKRSGKSLYDDDDDKI